MDPLTMAILGSAAIGGGSSILGGLFQSRSTSRAIDAQRQMFNQVLGLAQPFINAGQGAASTLSGLLRPGGNMSSLLQTIPGFQFLQDITQRGVSNQGTVTGLGGNTLLAGANAGNQIALSSGWNPIVNALQNLTNTGTSALSPLASIAGTTSSGIASSTIGQGNALAGASVGAGNAVGNALTTNALLSALTRGNGMYQNQGTPGGTNPLFLTP